MTRWHPWRALGRMPGVIVEWSHELPVHVLGDTDGLGHIRMAADLLQVERRCTLTHELIHVERGHHSHCDGPVERSVEAEAARRLIPLEALADALAWSQDEWEVADELWVDVDTARARIDNLTPAEKMFIDRRIAATEGAA